MTNICRLKTICFGRMMAHTHRLSFPIRAVEGVTSLFLYTALISELILEMSEPKTCELITRDAKYVCLGRTCEQFKGFIKSCYMHATPQGGYVSTF